MLPLLNAHGLPLTRDNFKIISASGTVIPELVRDDLGISVPGKDTAALTCGLEPVLPDLDPIPIPIWLVTHRELHTS